MVNYDDTFIKMADPSSYDNFIAYISHRVDRAIAAIEALVKAAILEMRNGARIMILTNSLWNLALTESSYHGNALMSKSRALMKQLAREVRL